MLYCTFPGDEQGPFPPLLIENNSPFPATVIYKDQTFVADAWSQTIYK